MDGIGYGHLDDLLWRLRAYSNNDLATLARVSRLFSDHALDQLWKQLRTFAPLMSLLPSDAVEVGSDKRRVSFRLFRSRVKSIYAGLIEVQPVCRPRKEAPS